MALEACAKPEPSAGGTSGNAAAAGAAAAPTVETNRPQKPHLPNPDSKLDSSLKHGSHPLSSTPGSTAGATSVMYKRYDPELPPLSSERTKKITMTVREVPVRILPDTVVAAWTFDGDIPGPFVHVR